MTTFRRYLLFQVPGWALATLVGAWVWSRGLAEAWLVLLVLAAWAVKDLALYPILRDSYRHDVATGVERLVGSVATACAAIDVEGQVRISGEVWRARLVGPGPVTAGDRVRIVGADGLTLYVRRDDAQ